MIKSKYDEKREEKIKEDSGVFKVAKGSIGRIPAET